MTKALDLNGKKVHAFALEMANLGFRRMTEKLLAILDDGAWQDFQDGLGRYHFLPGEFDYFLSQQGVSRDDIMVGIRDVEAKARLEEHMDERRTGESDYRRRVLEARQANPKRPGRPIEPYGLTIEEVNALVAAGADSSEVRRRPPLGESVRRWRNSEGATTRKPSELLPRPERLYRSARRLQDSELTDLIEKLRAELRQRR